MNPETLKYIESQQPQIDVLGWWVFLPNARTASTSITGAALADRAVMWHRGRRNWQPVWDKMIVPNAENVLFFTFVRNPWDRVVSAWRLLHERGRVEQNFETFLKSGEWLRKKWSHFFRPQTATFMRGSQWIEDVFIGRHETIDFHWRQIAQTIGAPLELPKRNATEHDHYATYYDHTTKKLVGSWYSVEIAELNYDF